MALSWKNILQICLRSFVNFHLCDFLTWRLRCKRVSWRARRPRWARRARRNPSLSFHLSRESTENINLLWNQRNFKIWFNLDMKNFLELIENQSQVSKNVKPQTNIIKEFLKSKKFLNLYSIWILKTYLNWLKIKH